MLVPEHHSQLQAGGAVLIIGRRDIASRSHQLSDDL
jgi:hypothetical protein